MDRRIMVCGGIGEVMLRYNHRNMALVSFAAEDGFDLVAAYRLNGGMYISPLQLHERVGGIAALNVQSPHESGPIYQPKIWPDGGYSLRSSSGENLSPEAVGNIGISVGRLLEAFSEPTGPNLSLVREA
jgi:hypothetical protein